MRVTDTPGQGHGGQRRLQQPRKAFPPGRWASLPTIHPQAALWLFASWAPMETWPFLGDHWVPLALG